MTPEEYKARKRKEYIRKYMADYREKNRQILNEKTSCRRKQKKIDKNKNIE